MNVVWKNRLCFLYHKALRRLKKRPPLIDKGNYRNTVILAGNGRSGSTWIQNIINYKNEYRILFEPFHNRYVDILSRFKYRQYLRPQNNDPAFLKPAEIILSGKIRNKWIDRANRRLFSKKRLLKDIRANLILKWIKTNFPEIPIILLLRHPCAVAASRTKFGWESHLEEFLSQPKLLEDFLHPFKSEMEKAQTDFEKQIFLWSIENYVPLKQFSPGQIYIVFYENFCVKPEEEVTGLFNYLKKPLGKKVYKTLKIPSGTSRKTSPIYSRENLLDGYKKVFTQRQIKRAVEILTLFGLQKIYSIEPMPRTDKTSAFLKS